MQDLRGKAAHLVEVRGEEGEAPHGGQVVCDRVREAVPEGVTGRLKTLFH